VVFSALSAIDATSEMRGGVFAHCAECRTTKEQRELEELEEAAKAHGCDCGGFLAGVAWERARK